MDNQGTSSQEIADAINDLSATVNSSIEALDKVVEGTSSTITAAKEPLVAGLDGFMDQVSTAMGIVGEKLVELSPEALDALLGLIQIKGIFDVGVALIPVLVSTVLLLGTPKLWKWAVKRADRVPEYNEADGFIFFWMYTVSSIVAGIASLGALLDFNNWLAALYPEGALALKALEAVGFVL